MKRILVAGGGGFIGHHLVNRLKAEGHFVRAVDLKRPEFEPSHADEFMCHDLRKPILNTGWLFHQIDEVYQLAADMGGAGFVFTGENDADILHNNTQINLTVLECCRLKNIKKIFFASSACVYTTLVGFTWTRGCKETDAYPANPDSNYGWEKLYAERLYDSYKRNHDIQVRIGRYHNIFGPLGTWTGGREKAPAALCRKIAETPDGGEIQMWGDGNQQRSFLYIDECIEATRRLMDSDYDQPVNIGSSQMVSLNWLADTIMGIAGKRLTVEHIPGPIGVRGRNSDNTLIKQVLGWEPTQSLTEGLAKTYPWIKEQVDKARVAA